MIPLVTQMHAKKRKMQEQTYISIARFINCHVAKEMLHHRQPLASNPKAPATHLVIGITLT